VFRDLSRRRQSGHSGPQRISFPEIQAYCALMRMGLRDWEVTLISTLDDDLLEIAREYLDEQPGGDDNFNSFGDDGDAFLNSIRRRGEKAEK
jgi:hypothetical protein